jgi:hypothetical protein
MDGNVKDLLDGPGDSNAKSGCDVIATRDDTCPGPYVAQQNLDTLLAELDLPDCTGKVSTGRGKSTQTKRPRLMGSQGHVQRIESPEARAQGYWGSTAWSS